jgi:hypothetical protein
VCEHPSGPCLGAALNFHEAWLFVRECSAGAEGNREEGSDQKNRPGERGH